MGRSLAAFFLMILGSGVGHASSSVTTVTMSLEQNIEAPRWMYDSKVKIKGGAVINHMVEAKRALMKENRVRCLSELKKAFALGKSLAPWLALNQLECAQLSDKKGVSIAALNQAVARVDTQPQWLLSGPAASQLKSAYVDALLLLTQSEIKSDRSAAWKNLNKLETIQKWLDRDQRASVYKWEGELAFVEQNLTAAQDFFQRSLSQKDDADLRGKIESIRAALLGNKHGAPVSETPAAPPANQDLGISDEEKTIYDRFNRSLQTQDYVSAVDDGLDLIEKFPGSRRAGEVADKVLDIYLSVSARTEEKFRHVRDSIVHTMLNADSGRLANWANAAYQRGNYSDARNLADQAYSKYAGNPLSTRMLLLAAKSALASGEEGEAASRFNDLIRRHGGTNEAAEASFRLGLLEYQNKRYAQSAADFERLLALTGSKDYEYRALYWQWRSHQKIDAGKADPYAQALIDKYPLTYYGLRAKAELNHGQLELPKAAVTVKAELHFLQADRLAWERLLILLKAGWFKEAEAELNSLPDPISTDERLARAKLWAADMRYDTAIRILNRAFDDSPELQQLAVLKMVFPREFESWISRASKADSVGENWIRSLIRQESAFRPDAQSSSGALGVMQLLPATGQELAHDFKIKNFDLPDALFDPETNIKLGTAYLSRLVHNFSGNIPLALAAYNAGPTRLRRWLSARKDLSPLEKNQTSAPDVEVWIDELPWEETSFYVKSILRNWLIYRLLDGSKVALGEPIWLDAKPGPR